MAFMATMRLPSGVTGPVDRFAFSRLARICSEEVDIKSGAFLSSRYVGGWWRFRTGARKVLNRCGEDLSRCCHDRGGWLR